METAELGMEKVKVIILNIQGGVIGGAMVYYMYIIYKYIKMA